MAQSTSINMISGRTRLYFCCVLNRIRRIVAAATGMLNEGLVNQDIIWCFSGSGSAQPNMLRCVAIDGTAFLDV